MPSAGWWRCLRLGGMRISKCLSIQTPAWSGLVRSIESISILKTTTQKRDFVAQRDATHEALFVLIGFNKDRKWGWTESR